MKDPHLARILMLSTYGLAMIAVSAFFLTTLFWVSPLWLEPLAVWRGPALTDTLALSEEDVPQVSLPEAIAAPSILHDMAISVNYEPRLGALAEHPMGAALAVPIGALRQAATLRLEPVWPVDSDELPNRATLLGFGFRVWIDGDLDKSLRKEATLTLRIFEDTALAGRLRIVQQDGGGWKVPTTHHQGNQLRIQVQNGGLFFPVAWGESMPSSHLNYLIKRYLESGALVNDARLNRLYDTQHFQIFFADRGVHAVPGDASFPLTPTSQPERVNTFVTLVGETLERVYQKLNRVGLARLDKRLNVYLSSAHDDALTPLGGPLWISVDTELYDLDSATAQVRGSVTEALFRALLGQGTAWFNDMQAVFLTELFWQQEDDTVDYLRHVMARYPLQAARLLQVPMAEGNRTQHRLYAAFFWWLNQRGDVPDLIRRVQHLDQLNPSVVSSLLQQRGQPSLGDLLAFFARDFYHDRYWQNEGLAADLFTGNHVEQALLQSRVAPAFVRQIRNWDNIYRNVEGLDLPPLTSSLVPLADLSPLDSPAKLVLLAEFKDRIPVVALASAHMAETLPLAGVADRFIEIQTTETRAYWSFVATPDAGLANHISVIFSNTSDDEPVEITRLARWMLHAPVWAEATFENGLQRLSWQATVSEQLAPVFAGYHVYALQPGQDFSEAEPIERGVMVPTLAFEAASSARQFAVTLADVYGNESPPTFFSHQDPFTGTWRGRFRWLGSSGGLGQDLMLQQLMLQPQAGVTLPNDQHFLWQVGIPVRLELSRERGQYHMQVKELGIKNRLPERPASPWLRLSPYGLFRSQATGFQRNWTLSRPDEIRGTLQTNEGTLDWYFWRVAPEGSGS